MKRLYVYVLKIKVFSFYVLVYVLFIKIITFDQIFQKFDQCSKMLGIC